MRLLIFHGAILPIGSHHSIKYLSQKSCSASCQARELPIMPRTMQVVQNKDLNFLYNLRYAKSCKIGETLILLINISYELLGLCSASCLCCSTHGVAHSMVAYTVCVCVSFADCAFQVFMFNLPCLLSSFCTVPAFSVNWASLFLMTNHFCLFLVTA